MRRLHPLKWLGDFYIREPLVIVQPTAYFATQNLNLLFCALVLIHLSLKAIIICLLKISPFDTRRDSSIWILSFRSIENQTASPYSTPIFYAATLLNNLDNYTTIFSKIFGSKNLLKILYWNFTELVWFNINATSNKLMPQLTLKLILTRRCVIRVSQLPFILF